MDDLPIADAADPATGLFDVKRLAALLDVKPATVRTLRSRGRLPVPTSEDINGGAVWASEIVAAFLKPDDGYDSRVSPDPMLPSVIDLFAGCGGMSLGFQLARFRVLAGYDNWKPAVDTYNQNKLGHEAKTLDLGDVELTIAELEHHRQPDGSFPSIIGGPPCQDFSSAGKRVEGERADLTEKYASIVTHFRPPFFVMENVARAAGAAAYHRALSVMEDAGYTIVKKVLNSAYCGVPQTRKRLIAFGSLSAGHVDRVRHYWETAVSEEAMTVRDWFGTRLETEYYYRHPRSYARRGIFSVDEPSPTIRGVNRPIPAGYPGHEGDPAPASQARPLTTAERAEIQTFPRGFTFAGSRTDTEQMIGNAVPVKLGKFVADSISFAYNTSGVSD
ncbi:DNA (cytosine-5-)-methyltransferase [Brevibacterium sp. 'Marine']|uniref:DNA cytosine methyltransferase n=1 Tax=Brevibacterium sp. 'Marine' TaxID=2725563 RepID=UPI00145D2ED5|nr:DNA (cytosine-5-)-methyltransferase [Brevibacterium sp. 'Marine']